ANLERIAADESAHLDRRIPAAFAIGHALDAQGDWAAALRAYERAHSLAKRRDAAEGRRFDAAALATRRAAILAFDYDIVPRATAATRDPRPVFIVGMPRSGTTLIEAVIAAHPQVLGCGERLAMPPLVDALIGAGDTLTTPRADLARELRRRYLLGLPSLGTANYFTDKQPFNFEAIALIDRLFPDAPIVHVHRDPLETCWSIYRQEFHKAWSFTHEFADIAAVYAHEVELLRAWSQRLPGRVIDIRYEEFVADFPEQARRLIAACGLPWDPACLEFQRNPRPIVTFSAVEAREPVASRNGRAARYGSLLAPLRAALAERGIQ
ncbi:MAG: sulfotransferase, partial [Steroidobacteraceae bacterium]|nr:sulfotransferase [Steroidobacteraceae bacterium]MDW8259121.1 sulfotransferase [Gammaproteobacteria bacterium]